MYNEEFILARVEHYSKVMGIPVCDDIVFDLMEYIEPLRQRYPKIYKDYMKYELQKDNYVLYGANRNMGEKLYFNLETNRTKKQLENTVIHELIHTKYPSLKHGVVFGSYIKQIRKGVKYPKKPWYHFLDIIAIPLDKWMKE